MAGKSRSRNYPAFGLPDAIMKARQLYEQDGRATVPSEVAVRAWGYGGLNGASLRTLGAVRQYGLLDAPAPKSVRLSHDALTILLEPSESPEYAEAIRQAAGSPAMFAELRQQYPDHLPSDAAMVSWLVRSHGFNEEAAKGLIASYRDTLALVDQAGKRDIAPRTDRPEESRREPGGDSTPARQTGGQVHSAVFSYKAGNTVATVTLEGPPPGEGAVRLLSSFLDLVKQSLATEAAKGPESQTAPGEGAGAV